jgi:hypothetical protein
MCVPEYFYTQLYPNRETAPDSFSSKVPDPGSLSRDRNTSVEEESTRLGQVLARIREIFWHLSA